MQKILDTIAPILNKEDCPLRLAEFNTKHIDPLTIKSEWQYKVADKPSYLGQANLRWRMEITCKRIGKPPVNQSYGDSSAAPSEGLMVICVLRFQSKAASQPLSQFTDLSSVQGLTLNLSSAFRRPPSNGQPSYKNVDILRSEKNDVDAIAKKIEYDILKVFLK
jgi:hypothetical protein